MPKLLSPAPSYGLFILYISYNADYKRVLFHWFVDIPWLNTQDALSKFVNTNYNQLLFSQICGYSVTEYSWCSEQVSECKPRLTAIFFLFSFFKKLVDILWLNTKDSAGSKCGVIISHELFHSYISCYSYQIYRLLVICVAAQESYSEARGGRSGTIWD